MINLGTITANMSTMLVMKQIEFLQHGSRQLGFVSVGEERYYLSRPPENPGNTFVVQLDNPALGFPEEVKRGTSAEVALFLQDMLRVEAQ